MINTVQETTTAQETTTVAESTIKDTQVIGSDITAKG